MADKPVEAAAAAEAPLPATGQAPDMHLTHTAFIEFTKTSLIPDAKLAQTDAVNSFTAYRANKILRWRSRCEAQKASQTLHFYQALNDHITILARKDAQQIQARINAASDASSGDKGVNGKFAAAFAALKNAKDKLKAARANGEELFNNFKDSAYADDVSKLAKSFKDGTLSKTDNQENLQKAIEELKIESYRCFDLADDSVEIAVKVSGIQASANVKSLKAPGDKLVELVGALQADIEANIKSAQANLTDAQKKYNTQLETVVAANFSAHADALKLGGLLGTIVQAREPDCEEWSHDKIVKKLQGYAERIESNFNEIAREGIPSAGKTPPRHP